MDLRSRKRKRNLERREDEGGKSSQKLKKTLQAERMGRDDNDDTSSCERGRRHLRESREEASGMLLRSNIRKGNLGLKEDEGGSSQERDRRKTKELKNRFQAEKKGSGRRKLLQYGQEDEDEEEEEEEEEEKINTQIIR